MLKPLKVVPFGTDPNRTLTSAVKMLNVDSAEKPRGHAKAWTTYGQSLRIPPFVVQALACLPHTEGVFQRNRMLTPIIPALKATRSTEARMPALRRDLQSALLSRSGRVILQLRQVVLEHGRLPVPEGILCRMGEEALHVIVRYGPIDALDPLRKLLDQPAGHDLRRSACPWPLLFKRVAK